MKISKDKILGRRVRALRESKGLTLKDMAERVGTSDAQLSRLESGQRGWNLEVGEKVANVLGVSLTLLQDESIPLDRLQQVAEVLASLSDLPDEQIEALLHLLRSMQRSSD